MMPSTVSIDTGAEAGAAGRDWASIQGVARRQIVRTRTRRMVCTHSPWRLPEGAEGRENGRWPCGAGDAGVPKTRNSGDQYSRLANRSGGGFVLDPAGLRPGLGDIECALTFPVGPCR